MIEIASTGATPTNGHQIRATGLGNLTINTDLLVTSTTAQTLSLGGANIIGVNTFGGKISDNPNATVGSTLLAANFSAGASTITLGSVKGLVNGAAISGTGIAGGTTITAINPATNQVTLSAVTTGSGNANSIITAAGVTNPISLRKGDAGTWVLTGSNSYTGDTTIQAGILQVKNSSALGSSSVSVTAGAKLYVNANNVTLANDITLNGTTTDGAIYSGDLGTGNVTNLSGQITLNATSNVSSWWNARTLQLSGKITGAGGLNFDRAGSAVGGRYYITAATNDYAGATSVTGAATAQFGYTGQAMLYLGATNALPTTTALTLNNADLYLNGQSQTLPSISGTGSFSVQNGSTTAATLILGSGNTTSTFSGSIKDNGLSVTYTAGDTAGTPTLTTGTVALTKIGNGTLTLSSANNYSGATNVNAGKLLINGSTSSTTAVTVADGATLGGSGAIGGSVTVQGGGTFAPGNGVESIATGNLALLASAIFAQEIDKSAAMGISGDLTATTGSLGITSGAILTLTELGTSGAWGVGDKITLIGYSTGIWNGGLFTYLGNTLTDDSNFTFSGIGWTFNYDDTTFGDNYQSDLSAFTGSARYVTMTAIPEPRTALLGGLGLLMLMRRRRS